jgi:hypothetical protein
MKLLFFILLVLLIAHVGFWPTLAALFGAVAMVVLLAFLAFGVVIAGGLLLLAGVFR